MHMYICTCVHVHEYLVLWVDGWYGTVWYDVGISSFLVCGMRCVTSPRLPLTLSTEANNSILYTTGTAISIVCFILLSYCRLAMYCMMLY